MDKKNWKKKLKEGVENALTKAYVFSQEHPIITAITTTVAGSVITGAVAYKVGERNGVTNSAHERLDGAKGYNIVVRGVKFEGKDLGDKPLVDVLNIIKDKDAAILFGSGVCELAQVVPEGKGLLVGHTVDNNYEVDMCDWIPNSEES